MGVACLHVTLTNKESLLVLVKDGESHAGNLISSGFLGFRSSQAAYLFPDQPQQVMEEFRTIFKSLFKGCRLVLRPHPPGGNSHAVDLRDRIPAPTYLK